MSEGYRVAVVGATGAVGTVMLRKLRERGFPAREVVPFASERSAGRELEGFGVVQPLAAKLGMSLVSDESMGKVSIVGAGMKTHPGVAAKVFSTLGREGINIEMISTSPIKISCVVRGDRVAQAVRALHETFELGEDDIRAEHPFTQGAGV